MALLPEYLTFLPRHHSNLAGSTAYEDLIVRGRRLKEPRNYFKGVSESAPLAPRNILTFSRTKASVLAQGGTTIPPHHRFVLIASLAGEGRVCAGSSNHLLRPGEALLMIPFQPHCFVDIAPDAIDWVFTTFEHPRDERLDVLGELGAWTMDEEELRCMRELLGSWQTKELQCDLPLYLALWLQRVVRRIGGVPKLRSKPLSSRDNSALVSSVNRFALERMHEPLSTTAVATGIGVSPGSLRARFKEATGRAIASHLREIKLYHACELLHGTKLRIGEISARCGYDSLFAFSRAFRHAYGCAPRDYRAKYAGAFPLSSEAYNLAK